MDNKSEYFRYLKVFEYVILSNSFIRNIGLFHGKMGCVLFFLSYANFSKSKSLEHFSNNLLNDIYEDINDETPINLENGLCGIGWGIDYLYQKGFVDGDIDVILEDIDRQVMEYDVTRMVDLSFHSGVAGIIFYVITRIAHGKKYLYDNAYLDKLRFVLHSGKLTKENDIPDFLIQHSIDVLNGKRIKPIELNEFINIDSKCEVNDFSKKSIGLENGLTGFLFSLLYEKKEISLSTNYPIKSNNIFIIDQDNRGSRYGIGSYIDILKKTLSGTKWNVCIVRINVLNELTVNISYNSGIQYVNIGGGLDIINNKESLLKRYQRNTAFILSLYYNGIHAPIFHFNYLNMKDMASVLKDEFTNSKLVLTVHYTNWSFELLGNRSQLKILLQDSNSDIYKSVEKEKSMLNICDGIISISKHSKDDLCSIYNIAPSKICLINHSIIDHHTDIPEKKRINIRHKYGYSKNELIILFVGRIEPVKGIDILLKSFIALNRKHKKLRLIICGDGTFSKVLSIAENYWRQITLTGFVEKNILWELYSLSDIGVVPSLHEEFGYVALEMMMMGLPIIASNTTGISEVVKDSGILVDFCEYQEQNVDKLKNAIDILLTHSDLIKYYSKSSRKRFLEEYDFDSFKNRMLSYYDDVNLR